MANKKGQITDDIIEWYVDRGFGLFRLDMRSRDGSDRVTPITQRGKKPRFGGWQRIRTQSLSQVRDWANKGINLGWKVPKGHVVIDIDPRNGGKLSDVLGFFACKNLKELADLHPVVVTGSGGYHIYCRINKAKLRIKTSLQGIDFKQYGGYVVIPGSYHFVSDSFYKFIDGEGLKLKRLPLLSKGFLRLITGKEDQGQLDKSIVSSPKLTSKELTSVLKDINVLSYSGREQAWRELMMAAHHATAGAGLGAFISWSIQDPQYAMDADGIEQRWNSLQVDGENSITYRHLLSAWYEHNKGGTIPATIQAKCDSANFSGVFDSALGSDTDDDDDEEIEGLYTTPEDTDDFMARSGKSDGEEKAIIEVRDRIDKLIITRMTDELFEAVYKMTLPFGSFTTTALQERLRKHLEMSVTNFRSKAAEIKIKNLNKEANKKLDKSFKALSELQDVSALIAKRVLNHFKNGQHVGYCREDLYTYDGKRWERQEETRIRQIATSEISEVAKETKKVFHVSKDAIELVKQFAQPLDFSTSPSKKADVFNFQNGEVWIGRRTGKVELRPHRPKSMQLYVSDYEYDPDEECPVFETALDRMFEGRSDCYEIIDYISELFGYTLSTNKNIAICVALIGTGSNGKSVLLNALKNILGPYSMNSPITALENSFTRSKLIGKLCLIDDDFAVDKKLPNEVIKKFSESKIIEAEEKFKSGFELQSNVVCWLSSNGWPYTGDSSNAVFRRLHFIPFDNIFKAKDADVNINQKIRDETAGVFNFAVAGLQRLRRRGYFDKPETVQKASEVWNMSTNTVATFMEDYRQQGNTSRFIGVKTLYELYKEWCTETRQHTLSRLIFKRILSELRIKETSKGLDLGVKYVDWGLLEKLLDDEGGEVSIRKIEDACDERCVDAYSHSLLREYCKAKGYRVKSKGQQVLRIDAT